MANDLTLYRSLSGQMQSGDLIEWTGKTILARMIRFFTKKPVNHSSLLLRIDYVDLSDRRFVLEALAHGLEFNLLSKSLENYRGQVYWTPLKSRFNDKREKMSSWAILKKAEHVGYDYESLFAQIFGRVSIDGRQYFCSEYYHAALIFAGIAPQAKKALRPGEFGALGVHEATQRIL